MKAVAIVIMNIITLYSRGVYRLTKGTLLPLQGGLWRGCWGGVCWLVGW